MGTYNIYCDESCHLEFDKSPIMVMGAIWFDYDQRKEITTRINNIKSEFGISKFRELKWTKVSPALHPLYEKLIEYFFEDNSLHFRALIVDNKQAFRHDITQSYDDWYFKMYYHVLRPIIDRYNEFNIYIDIKDTCSRNKIQKLHEVACNHIRDFDHSHILNVKAVRSEEIAVMQIVDLLIGALSYYCRKLNTSQTKVELVNLIQRKVDRSFAFNTPTYEQKFNIFHLQLEEPHV